MLVMSLRPSSGNIVRNSNINGGWGTEERKGGFAIAAGQPFDIFIVFGTEGYQVI